MRSLEYFCTTGTCLWIACSTLLLLCKADSKWRIQNLVKQAKLYPSFLLPPPIFLFLPISFSFLPLLFSPFISIFSFLSVPSSFSGSYSRAPEDGLRGITSEKSNMWFRACWCILMINYFRLNLYVKICQRSALSETVTEWHLKYVTVSFAHYRMTRLKRRSKAIRCLKRRSRTSRCWALKPRSCVRILTLTGWLRPVVQTPRSVSVHSTFLSFYNFILIYSAFLNSFCTYDPVTVYRIICNYC